MTTFFSWSWAKEYPELYKTCTLFEIQELCSPIKYVYSHRQSYLQQGPQCGLVALAMALDLASKNFIDDLFDLAKKQGFSNNGEIFSAQFMVSLCKQYLPPDKVSLYEGDLNSETIRNALFEKKLLLVPYDSDANFCPGFLNGAKAHWTLVCGAAQSFTNEFYVFAKHGKSRNLAVWSLDSLARSNAQLMRVGPEILMGEFIIPEGGIAGELGLCKKAVVLEC